MLTESGMITIARNAGMASGRVVPRNTPHAADHQRADQNEWRRNREYRVVCPTTWPPPTILTSGDTNSASTNSTAATETGQPGSSAGGPAGAASMYAVTVDVPSSAEDGPDRISQGAPCFARGSVPSRIRPACSLADTDQRADRIEQRQEEEDENDGLIVRGQRTPISSCRSVGRNEAAG
jgi:hypothetical protein